MSSRFADPRVVDLVEETAELWMRISSLRDQRRKRSIQTFRGGPVPRSALWALAFYAALASFAVLWRYSDHVGLPRLLMGSLLLFCVLLTAGSAVVWTHPLWIIAIPSAIVVAAFLYYPLAPAATLLTLAFMVNTLWLA